MAQRQAHAAVQGSNDSFQPVAKRTLTTLRRGSTGPEVRGIQAKLQLLTLMSANEVKSGPGVYGPRTEASIRRFQDRVGLPVTGIADPATRAALMIADRKDHETTAPVVPALDLSRMAQTLTGEEDDDDEPTVGLGRAS